MGTPLAAVDQAVLSSDSTRRQNCPLVNSWRVCCAFTDGERACSTSEVRRSNRANDARMVHLLSRSPTTIIDLGFAREHFVRMFVSFLPERCCRKWGDHRRPRTEIRTARRHSLSGRLSVITSLTPVGAHLAEGVIATIEVKSTCQQVSLICSPLRERAKSSLARKSGRDTGRFG